MFILCKRNICYSNIVSLICCSVIVTSYVNLYIDVISFPLLYFLNVTHRETNRFLLQSFSIYLCINKDCLSSKALIPKLTSLLSIVNRTKIIATIYYICLQIFKYILTDMKERLLLDLTSEIFNFIFHNSVSVFKLYYKSKFSGKYVYILSLKFIHYAKMNTKITSYHY